MAQERPGFFKAKDIAEAGYIYGLPIVMNYGIMYEYAIDRNSGQFDDPGSGAVPPVVFLTSRAVHPHFDFWKCIKYHGPGVETRGNWLIGGWTPNEDVVFDAAFG